MTGLDQLLCNYGVDRLRSFSLHENHQVSFFEWLLQWAFCFFFKTTHWKTSIFSKTGRRIYFTCTCTFQRQLGLPANQTYARSNNPVCQEHSPKRLNLTFFSIFWFVSVKNCPHKMYGSQNCSWQAENSTWYATAGTYLMTRHQKFLCGNCAY